MDGTMDCEQAANLISARLDGELATADADSLALDAHLAGCAACRAAAEATSVQDAALSRAFAGRRRAAAALAERVQREQLAAASDIEFDSAMLPRGTRVDVPSR